MEKLIIILFAACFMASCSKGEDYAYLNTDRRNCGNVSLVSNRYTSDWRHIKDVVINYGEKCGNDYAIYKTFKPDTLISSCSIDKIDSLFRIEIRYYKTN